MQLCFTVLLLLNLCLLLFGQLAMSFSVEYKVYSIVGEVAAERFEYSLFSGAAELYRRGLWPLARRISSALIVSCKRLRLHAVCNLMRLMK